MNAAQQHLDHQARNDNRQYDYSEFADDHRAEYDIVLKMLEQKASVLDLGCGNGSLLQLLQKEKQCQVSGMELSPSGVAICRQKGLEVIEGSIDQALPYSDKQFDYSICNVTLQMVYYPEITLKEMARVSRYQIISFPNFAYWKNRLDLLLNGRMPKPGLFGYQWYNTGHIHQFSISDFNELTNSVSGLRRLELEKVAVGKFPIDALSAIAPNLFIKIAVCKLESQA
jgi:methionine biosynthesis protein MetW